MSPPNHHSRSTRKRARLQPRSTPKDSDVITIEEQGYDADVEAQYPAEYEDVESETEVVAGGSQDSGEDTGKETKLCDDFRKLRTHSFEHEGSSKTTPQSSNFSSASSLKRPFNASFHTDSDNSQNRNSQRKYRSQHRNRRSEDSHMASGQRQQSPAVVHAVDVMEIDSDPSQLQHDELKAQAMVSVGHS